MGSTDSESLVGTASLMSNTQSSDEVFVHPAKEKRESEYMPPSVDPNEELKLEHRWIWWYDDSPPKGSTCEEFESRLKRLGSFNTVQNFWRFFNVLKDITQLPDHSNLSLFKEGVKPLYEDNANTRGGKWVWRCNSIEETQDMWFNLILAVIGGQFEEYNSDLCGVVLAIRNRTNSFRIWNSNSDDIHIEKMKEKIRTVLALDRKIKLEYHNHAKTLEYKLPEKKKKKENFYKERQKEEYG